VKKDQKKIKGTTKPLMANLDITLIGESIQRVDCADSQAATSLPVAC